MDNDCLVVIYKTAFSNHNELTRKIRKLMTSWDCLQTTFFSSNNGHKYYISMNFKILQTPSNSIDFKENF